MAQYKASSIGLDIGSRYIKLVELKKIGSNIVLTKFGIKEIPRDVTLDKDTLTCQLISQLLTETKIKPRPINISMSGQSVFIRFIKLLQVRQDKLKQIMKFEAQNQIPFPLPEVFWDWSLLEKDAKANNKLVLVAVKKNLVDELMSKLKITKLSTGLIDVSPITLYNCMAFNEDYNQSAVSGLVDIGAKSTNLVISNKGNIWIRSFPIACDRIEEAKEQGIEELAAELQRSVEYYFMQQEDSGAPKKLDELVLTGGGSMQEPIESMLEAKFNIKPRILDPFRKLHIAKDIFPATQAKGIKNQLSLAVGLGLRGIIPLPIEVNFLKELLSEKELALEKRVYASLSMALAAAIVISLSAFMRQDYAVKKAKLDKVEEMIELYKDYEPKIKRAEEKEGVLKDKTAALYSVASSRALWLDVLKVISEMAPKDVWLTDVSGVVSIEKSDLGRLDVDGRALSYQSVNNFVSSLKSSPGFKDVKPISSSVEKDKDTGEEIVKFSITMDVIAGGS